MKKIVVGLIAALIISSSILVVKLQEFNYLVNKIVIEME